MDWKLFATAFATIFLAELGDKTQLATLTFAAGSPRAGLTVFLGAALALVLTTGIAVLLGEAVSRVVHPVWLERIAAVAFICIGGWMLFRSLQG